MDLNAFGEDFLRDPYPHYARLRDGAPVTCEVQPTGMVSYLVSSYEHARGLLVDPRFSSSFAHADVDNLRRGGLLNSAGDTTVHRRRLPNWKIHLVDTGLQTQTGGRIKRLREWIGDETFMLTYGDGVANVNVRELLEFKEDTAGGLMNTEYISLHEGATVADAFRALKGNEDQLESLNSLFLGGGSYTFPRYLRKTYPRAFAEVAEIDPAVTRANYRALGLPEDTPIVTHWGDARQFVERNQDNKQFDLIFGDAFNDFSVPWHLTTREFNDKLASMLTDDGVYMINIIDAYESDARAERNAERRIKKLVETKSVEL